MTFWRSIGASCLSAILGFAATTGAQTPPAGEGDITVTYERALTRGQLNNAGDLIAPDSTDAHALMSEVQFGITNRFAVSASLPYMTVRFAGGPHPHLVNIHGQPSNLDNGQYHGTAQDFHFGGQWGLVQSRRLIVTPFAEAIIPSHDYESLGQSVVGRNLRALTVGSGVGGFADVLPGLYFQTNLSHTVVQKVLGIRPNRSRVDSEVGYFVTPHIAFRFLETFQFIHDGVDFVGSTPAIVLHRTGATSVDIRLNHDRLLRTNVLNLGGGVSLAVTDSVDILATAVKTAWGENVQRNRAVTIGANWHFRTRGTGVPRPSRHPLPRFF